MASNSKLAGISHALVRKYPDNNEGRLQNTDKIGIIAKISGIKFIYIVITLCNFGLNILSLKISCTAQES